MNSDQCIGSDHSTGCRRENQKAGRRALTAAWNNNRQSRAPYAHRNIISFKYITSGTVQRDAHDTVSARRRLAHCIEEGPKPVIIAANYRATRGDDYTRRIERDKLVLQGVSSGTAKDAGPAG
jgi:hypothetical protein